MEIQHRPGGKQGTFYIEDRGKELARMNYTMKTERLMAIDHTEVGRELQGQGAGLRLVSAAVEYARQHQLKIIPYCEFAKAMFNKKPMFHDVLQV